MVHVSVLSKLRKFVMLALCLCTGCLANAHFDVGATGLTGIAPGDSSGNTNAPQQAGTTPIAANHLPTVSACTTQAPAPRALRRLTSTELTNTVIDLFNDTGVPAATGVFSDDAVVYGFHDIAASLEVRDNGALALQIYAESVASYAGGHLWEVGGCSSFDANCEASVINGFGKRAFRRPLTQDEVQDYLTLFASMPDFNSGTQAMVSAMLQSPAFVYRSELGVPDAGDPNSYHLTPYEVASELSYAITSAPPDATLIQAADNNQLSAPAQVMAQAVRLSQTPRAHAALDEFFLEWLQVSELSIDARTEGNTTLQTATKQDMYTEAQMMVDEVLFNGGTFATLFDTNVTYVNQELATFYGATNVSGGNTFSTVSVQTLGRDTGVLALGGVLAAASQTNIASPTLRGRMMRMRLLCDSIPPPPANVPPITASNNGGTVRDLYFSHMTNTGCSTCHVLMDPLGFTQGMYDTIGRLRPGGKDNGIAVDVSGSVANASTGSSTPVANLAALNLYMSQSDTVGACLSRHWTMYALGSVSWDQDGCTFDSVAQVARTSNYNLQATILGLTTVDSFTHRALDP